MANITGTSGDDSRSGGNDADHMFGLAGNDTLQGFNNNDTLDGGSGNDSLIGGNGGGTGDGGDSLFGGTGSDTLDGSGNPDTLDGGTGADSMFGGGGGDTYVVDDAKDIVNETGNVSIDTVQTALSFDLNANGVTVLGDFENLTLTSTAAVSGTGNALANKITGNSGANTLTGNGGDDTLDGGAGADSMIGGAGDDTYVIDNAGDKILETGVDANDTVISKFSVDLNDLALSGIEHATLTGTAAINATGNALVNHLTGNDGANKLAGGGGDDTIVAGNGNDTLDGGAGIDRLIGGIGNDTYLVDDTADVVDEFNGGAGIDTVLSSASAFTLSFALENLTLLGGGIVGTGNELNNKIIGNIGANEIDGLGGADTMAGGDGNDAYFVDDKGDVVTEAAGAGRDRVNTGISFVLGANLEDLRLEDTAGDINGTGNVLANFLLGNSGKNVLNGLAGDDTMTGRGGNDTYVVDSAKDVLNETAKSGGGGTDLVQSSIAFDLNGNGTTVLGSIENLTLTGSAAIAGTGNELANAMTGNSGANTLTGNDGDDTLHGGAGADGLVGGIGDDTLDGGTGADTLEGGDGNDSYVIDSAADKIVESAADLNDRVLAAISVDLNLAAFANIEHATLTGSGALNAIGNAGANMLIGNAGANKLDGGTGSDTLIGGTGNDVYAVDSFFDVAIEFAGQGIDTVISSASSFTLGAFVENLTMIGASSNGIGNALANKMTGTSSGVDNLFGLDGNDTLIGSGNAFDILDGGVGADSMVGGKGGDTYVVDDIGDKILESGPTGEFDVVDAFITFTLGATLETLILLGADDIDGTGNALNNVLGGNKGNNVLSGLAGDDNLIAHEGDDLLLGGAGNDTLIADADADTLVGGAGSDRFFFAAGLAGIDVIADLDGLPGGDKIEVGQLLTGFAAPASNFFQTVTANGSTTIKVDTNGAVGGAAFVDLAVLQGVSTDLDGLLANGTIVMGGAPIVPVAASKDGTAANDTLAGGLTSTLLHGLAGNDSLTGNAGADTLDGGAGLDTLAGGAGDDSYVIDNVKDVTAEAVGDANDRVLASIAVDLSNKAFDNIEHVTLTGTAALNATGDEGANMLIGNAGANILDGKGGDDTTAGGAGNDSYMVDSGTDVVIEFAGDGTDTIISTAVAYLLGAFVENLTLAGDLAISGIGNGLANKITGNSGNNGLAGQDGNDTLIGNDGKDQLFGGAGADSLVGGNGNDSYSVDNIGDKITESGPASDQDRVNSTITFTLGANLEVLVLSGADAIDGTGNALNNFLAGNGASNVLSGLAGNDSLSGGAGADLLLGGDGNDVLFADDDGDTLVGGAGSDKFAFSISPIGVAAIADFNGLPGGDQLDFSGLIGLPPAGSESLFIQTVTANGSTTIRLDQDGLGSKFAFLDLVVLQGVNIDFQGLLANGAIAGLATPATPPIDGTAGVDNLNGTPISDLMHGLAGNDLLTGNGVADTLDGGTGTDTMVGGAGNDSYVVDNAKDVINELGGDLDDRVLASIAVNLQLAAFAGIEHATLTGTAALNATGNAGANMLIGNAGANLLDGATGDDTLIGGAGNDTYKVDSVSDVVIERPGEGTDTVISTATEYTLSSFVEHLTLAGNVEIDGFGNALANKITGNAANNDLSGSDGNDTLIGIDGNDFLDGGAGADSLVGGNGQDFYLVDNIGDKILESGPVGEFDEVDAFITFTLGPNLDDLGLFGFGAIDGTGNGLNNFIDGNDGNNVLSGLAGNDTLEGDNGDDLALGGDGNDVLFSQSGLDTLVGGAGSDVFLFRSSPSGVDVIADFNGLPGGDTIDVSDLLSGFVEDVSNVNDFLRAVQANGSTTLQVDIDGAVGGAAFVDMAVLQGVSTSISGLLNNGSLVLD